MNLLSFIQSINKKSDFFNTNVVLFSGSEYPQLFFPIFLEKLKQVSPEIIEKIDVGSVDRKQVKAMLSVSFLGQQIVYWLGNLDSLSVKEKEHWLSYVDMYNGPHVIMAYVGKSRKSTVENIVDIDDSVSINRSAQIISFLHGKQHKNASLLLSKIERHSKKISLDKLTLLSFYGVFLGRRSSEFISDWLPKMVPNETSLFALAQSFFSKKRNAFAKQWKDINETYPVVFWVVFWSEQLWRAHSYVSLMQKKEIAAAKKISYRLPFSFINVDWRKYKAEELKNAHDFIYSLDFEIKNGGNDCGLDVFYMKFLLNDFA